MSAALRLADVAIRFGGVQAVAGVSFTVDAGDLVGLIGPNGAGKSTLIKITAGLHRPDTGSIAIAGNDVTRWPAARRVRGGLAITHQIVKPFRSMTVLENVTLAAGYRWTASPLTALLRIARGAAEEHAAAILGLVGLAGTERKPVAALPLGQLKRLELARALAVDPKVVLLDEPLAGLNHAEARQQVDTIVQINAGGVATVLVEHNLAEVTRVCRRVLVLDAGRLIADGDPVAVMQDPAVREAYVGAGGDAAA
jgi:branched-chain amino acid transport system ATP-binding protein